MKRFATILAILALAALLAAPAFADDDDAGRYGPGWGMGYGMGPGMMGGGPGWGMGYGMGPGMMGGGMGWGGGYGHGYGMMGGGMMGPQMGALLAQLPPEKREQLRAHHFAMQRQMIAQRAEVAQARLSLAEAMQAFPLDHSKALEAFQKLNEARRAMFELRLAAMAQAQQIVGKELWEQMHSGYGMGFGPGGGAGSGPGMMGPGHMGPRR